MSKSKTTRELESASLNCENSFADAAAVSSEISTAKITLWGEIIKGWEWVVFSWKLLQRLGSFGDIMRTLFLVISLLSQRLLVQWGIIKKK
ncbi:MAG: hypothetical protein NVS2B14_08760 [Chamaesiphon sp.]